MLAAIGELNVAIVTKPGTCIAAIWNWVLTNHLPLVNAEFTRLTGTWMGTELQFNRLGILIFYTTIMVVSGMYLGFWMSACLSYGLKNRRQLANRSFTFVRRQWIKILLSPIWLVVSCIIAPFVVMARILFGILFGIHTFRRLATATATVGAGVVYLIFVPFNVGLPIALTSIGCGLACGTVAWIVAYLLDGERAKGWLKTHLFAPLTDAFPPLDFGLARKSV